MITDGGDQPNVVPSVASVWYYFREQTFEGIQKNYAIGNKIADAAAAMTDTTVTRRIRGTAAPMHFNKPMAEAAQRNIQAVGLPAWSADEQAFAKAVQKNLGAKEEGLAVKLDERWLRRVFFGAVVLLALKTLGYDVILRNLAR